MVSSLEKQVRKTTDELVAVQLNESTPEVWTILLDGFKDEFDLAENKLSERAKRFGVADEELSLCIKLLRRNTWEAFLKKIHDETEDSRMIVKIKNRLDSKFRYDEQGLPRVWKPEDDIDTPFSVANEEALKLIPLFAKITTDDSKLDMHDFFSMETEYDYMDSLILFGAAKQQELATRFRRESEAMFLEAKRSLVATEARVPYWMMVLLVVLGWNEFWSILTSPIYLMFTIFFGVTGYIIYMLNLAGPAEQVLRGVGRQVMTVMQQKIAESSKARQQGDEIEMRKMQ